MNTYFNSNLAESRFNSKNGCLATLKITEVSLLLYLHSTTEENVRCSWKFGSDECSI